MPPGVASPLFLCELALELKMSVGELCYGRGTPMSAHELCVVWPAFFEVRQRQAEREAEKNRGRR